jgi:hypothetical protein
LGLKFEKLLQGGAARGELFRGGNVFGEEGITMEMDARFALARG